FARFRTAGRELVFAATMSRSSAGVRPIEWRISELTDRRDLGQDAAGDACSSASTFGGESGVSSARTPRASATALLMQAGTPMIALSPMPLTPSGLRGEGVQTWARPTAGVSVAVGMR